MLSLIVAAAVSWPMTPLDETWARLVQDAAAHDTAAFATDRADIVRQDETVLTRWGARRRETYEGPGYSVTTYDGPTRVMGERAQALYFAVVAPTGDRKAPTIWELTPGFAPRGGALWHVQEHGCRLETGDSVDSFPRTWTIATGSKPPSYEEFKVVLAATVGTRREFPADTYTWQFVGRVCYAVGGLTTAKVRPEPGPPASSGAHG